ncbi:hypothetical protein D9M68_816010 [compost metagenome]
MKSKQQGLPGFGLQRAHATRQLRIAFIGQQLVHGRGAFGLHVVRALFAAGALPMQRLLGFALAQQVDGAVAGDHAQPGQGAVLPRRSGCRAVPDRDKDLLQHILCHGAVLRHARGHGHQTAGDQTVEGLERPCVAQRNTRQQPGNFITLIHQNLPESDVAEHTAAACPATRPVTGKRQ